MSLRLEFDDGRIFRIVAGTGEILSPREARESTEFQRLSRRWFTENPPQLAAELLAAACCAELLSIKCSTLSEGEEDGYPGPDAVGDFFSAL